MKKEQNLQEPQKQALNIPVVICRTSFAGTISKNQFYLIVEHIDRLKQDGFKFEKHERVDNPDKIHYIMALTYKVWLFSNNWKTRRAMENCF